MRLPEILSAGGCERHKRRNFSFHLRGTDVTIDLRSAPEECFSEEYDRGYHQDTYERDDGPDNLPDI